MKKILAVLVLGMTAVYAQYGSYSGGSSNNNSYDSYSQYGGQQQQQQMQQMPQQQGSIPSDCSHLSQQEQQFANQLSDMHRTMFCRHFSVSQRIEAMTLASAGAQTLSGGKSEITPDEAVEVVMKNARQDQGNGAQQGNGQQQQQSPYGGSYSYPSKNGRGSSY